MSNDLEASASQSPVDDPGFEITGGKGVHITFENGWTVSIQWGPYNYCSNYDRPASAILETAASLGLRQNTSAKTAEVAAWDASETWFEFHEGDTVKGYLSPSDVLAFLNEIAALPNTGDPQGSPPKTSAVSAASESEAGAVSDTAHWRIVFAIIVLAALLGLVARLLDWRSARGRTRRARHRHGLPNVRCARQQAARPRRRAAELARQLGDA